MFNLPSATGPVVPALQSLPVHAFQLGDAPLVECASGIGDAMTLQGRVNNATPDTDGGGNGVLSRDDKVGFVFVDGKGVPPFQIQDIGQGTILSEIGFYCARDEYQRSTN